MRSRSLAGLVSGIVMATSAQTPSPGTWESFTDLSTVRSLAIGYDGSITAATGGGLFTLDPLTGTITTATNADGLATNDLTAVAVDSRGGLWIGASDGSLNHRASGSSEWRLLTDIRDSNRLQKSIQRLVPHGDTLFVVTQFGVSVYRLDRDEFADTYASFGYATPPNCWDVAIARDTVWLANDQGVAAAPASSPNLSAPTSWVRFGTVDGLPSSTVRAIVSFRDTLLAGTAAGTVARIGGRFVSQSSLSFINTKRLLTSGPTVVALTIESGQSVVSGLSHVQAPRAILAPAFSGIAADLGVAPSTGELWMGSAGLGIGRVASGVWNWQMPNGPRTNLFVNLALDAQGTLWAGTGINGGGRGFMRFKRDGIAGSRWKNFNRTTDPVMMFDDYYRANPSPDGSVWVSSWGGGVVQVKGDTVARRISTTSVPQVATSVTNDPTFAVIGGGAADALGRMWFTNRTAVDGNVLVRLDDDTLVSKFRNQTGTGEGRFASVLIDRNGTLWLANSEPTAKAASGLYYYNPSGSISGTSATGGWGTLTTTDGLPHNTIMALVTDQEGDVWVGTDLGVTIFNEPSNPRIQRSSSFPLREQSIQCLAVDGVNRKWAGTKEGVFIVSPDGSQLVAQYTVANTGGKLVSNDVRSVAIDQTRGIVYLGTEQGLSALAIAAVQPDRRFTTLAIGPNPFSIPSNEPLTIRNLVAQSRVKILGVGGTLVNEFDAQGGGRAFWDGRDRNGKLVGSGTYIIVAFNENGEQITTAKVAVVRR